MLDEEQFEIKCWSDIKKKTIKGFLIENYVIKNKKKYNLSVKTSQELLSLIYLGISFKNITADNILIKNNEIHSIQGISFKKQKMPCQIYSKIIKKIK